MRRIAFSALALVMFGACGEEPAPVTPAKPSAVGAAVWQSRAVFATEARSQLFITALDAPEPWLVSQALFRLDGNAPRDASWGPGLMDKYVARPRTPIPACVDVRQKPSLAWRRDCAKLTPARQATTVRLVEMMQDANPYTKSEAINAQGHLGNISAIRAIAPFLDDDTSDTYDIRGWQTLYGTNGRAHHDGSAWSLVRESALGALKTLSRRVDHVNPFEYQINGRTSADDLTEAAVAAHAWIVAHDADIPAS